MPSPVLYTRRSTWHFDDEQASRLYRHLDRYPPGGALLAASTSVSHRGTEALRSPSRIKLRRTYKQRVKLGASSVCVVRSSVYDYMRDSVRASCDRYVARYRGNRHRRAVSNNSAKREERGAHKGVGVRFRVVHSHVLLATAANRRLSCPVIRATSCAAFK